MRRTPSVEEKGARTAMTENLKLSFHSTPGSSYAYEYRSCSERGAIKAAVSRANQEQLLESTDDTFGGAPGSFQTKMEPPNLGSKQIGKTAILLAANSDSASFW